MAPPPGPHLEPVITSLDELTGFGSSMTWWLRMWCLIIAAVSPSVVVKPLISLGKLYYYQTPHPWTPKGWYSHQQPAHLILQNLLRGGGRSRVLHLLGTLWKALETTCSRPRTEINVKFAGIKRQHQIASRTPRGSWLDPLIMSRTATAIRGHTERPHHLQSYLINWTWIDWM